MKKVQQEKKLIEFKFSTVHFEQEDWIGDWIASGWLVAWKCQRLKLQRSTGRLLRERTKWVKELKLSICAVFSHLLFDDRDKSWNVRDNKTNGQPWDRVVCPIRNRRLLHTSAQEIGCREESSSVGSQLWLQYVEQYPPCPCWWTRGRNVRRRIFSAGKCRPLSK